MTDAENPFTISCDDCPLATPEYQFYVEDPQAYYDDFTFVIIPTNGAGNGTPSDPLMGFGFFQGSIHTHIGGIICIKLDSNKAHITDS